MSCGVCNKPTHLGCPCGVHYCSGECQQKHWQHHHLTMRHTLWAESQNYSATQASCDAPMEGGKVSKFSAEQKAVLNALKNYPGFINALALYWTTSGRPGSWTSLLRDDPDGKYVFVVPKKAKHEDDWVIHDLANPGSPFRHVEMVIPSYVFRVKKLWPTGMKTSSVVSISGQSVKLETDGTTIKIIWGPLMYGGQTYSLQKGTLTQDSRASYKDEETSHIVVINSAGAVLEIGKDPYVIRRAALVGADLIDTVGAVAAAAATH